ncbi:MAG: proprotein convertase P-domain-containing protein [Pseudomonadota bacterium]
MTEGLVGNNIDNVGNSDPAAGAINAVAPHPTNADILFVGSVNGGVWRTNNALAQSPAWEQQTTGQLVGPIGHIAFDPTDTSSQTLVAGYGNFSSFDNDSGPLQGVIRSTNGGATWSTLDPAMRIRSVSKVAVRGAVIMAAVESANSLSCGSNGDFGLFRSTNSGVSFSLVTNGLFGSGVKALAGDPSNPAVFYASITDFGGNCAPGGNGNLDGIYRSTDTGASWAKVSSPAMDALINDAQGATHFEISVAPTGAVFVAIVPNGRLAGVFRSSNGQNNWVQLATPFTTETPQGGAPTNFGIHPGGQGGIHTSFVADPTNDAIVYVGGDRQPWGTDETGGFAFPNSIGACSFSGRLFRINANLGFQPITHNFATTGGAASQCNFDATGTAPHADSRDMAFDAAGNLIEGDDGGVYRRSNPRSPTGRWFDVNGDMQVAEHHSGAFDRNSSVAVAGNQDNGAAQQDTFTSLVWGVDRGGDGGDVAIDYLAVPGRSVRYLSSQTLLGPQRLTYDANGNLINQVDIPFNPLSGFPIQGQFVTPIAVNQVSGGRLIIGGGNSVYESFDLGDNVSEVNPPGIVAAEFGRRPIAYGAGGNPDLLFVAAADTGLYRRTTANGSLSLVYTSSNGNQLQAVVVDPSDASRVFVLETNGVFASPNGGNSFSPITGSLNSVFAPGRLRTLAFLETPAGDQLALGADDGVYLATSAGGFSDWSEAADGLPAAPVFDIDYDPATERLVAFTLGRGTYVLTGGGGGSGGPQQFCSTPGAAIPDNSPGGLNNGLSVGATGTISNLTVTLQVTHTYVGDLRVTLRNGATGTQVTLMDRPIGGAGDCNTDNIDTVFADASGLPVANQCGATPPAISGTLRPDGSLAAFNNQAISGTWTLNISDNEGQDLGTLDRWCIQATLDGGSSGGALIFADSFEN